MLCSDPDTHFKKKTDPKLHPGKNREKIQELDYVSTFPYSVLSRKVFFTKRVFKFFICDDYVQE